VKALIADDHVIFRHGVRSILECIEKSAELFEASDFDQMLRLAERHPDLTVVIVDLRMPAMNAFAGLRALRETLPAIPILVLSASEDADDVFQALEAGASGYLAKSAPADTLVEALRLVMVGGIYVPRALIKGRETGPRQPPTAAAEPPLLTPRQREVLVLISAGYSNKEIAYRLGTSDGTIKAHISAIMRRLGVHNRVQLLLIAQQFGITTRPTC
jgi:DNA-binding NarL/FixJ family response regulator